MLAAFASSGDVRSFSVDLPIRTNATTELIDITEEIATVLRSAEVDTGIALVSSPHTTCAVIVNERESGFTKDFTDALERIAPVDAHYAHNDAPHDEEDEAPNGYAHVRAAILSSPSVLVPVREQKLALGRWQRVFFVELDRARPRRVQVTIVGRSA